MTSTLVAKGYYDISQLTIYSLLISFAQGGSLGMRLDRIDVITIRDIELQVNRLMRHSVCCYVYWQFRFTLLNFLLDMYKST